MRAPLAALIAAIAATALCATACSSDSSPEEAPSTTVGPPPGVTPPPVHAGFDYQLGGPYAPPAGVSVVARDHTAPPAAGVYNICYVNAFQAQPGAEKEWDGDLLLRDGAGQVVMDKEWNEALLDLRTDAKRQRVAKKVNAWIDGCAAKGYQAVEPDNYDSYSRAPKGLLTADHAKAFLALLAAHAHEKGLAIGQKNTADLAPARKSVGLDFAVVEECGQYDECGDYTDAFGDHVIVIEYTQEGLEKACSDSGARISVVRRDRDVVPAGEHGYVRGTCAGL
ncbi:endo alpha-1,4 polygalactosaminidase [Streptomyces sp. H39-S7]|uniref:endo alpha-1,4 polygalactosaminidase n=1 Tax=Streptomyces sp. H39-S7 TaxID=3004357 RepID=UPI0022AE6FA9|nr:endo alpha-1,4 polygalactosaminidase [Streptomyces sp. H39-S7]MCZ4125036.1 endo alpha-1,4 polygalactosaminidase [Streptomyces sp. H39-S7]